MGTKIEKCIATALKAGCPRDQVKTMIESAYIPLPWQWEFHAAARQADNEGGPVDIGLGGARGPGKSHAVLSQVAIDDCQRYPGLKCLFLRQTGVAAKESFDDLVKKVIHGHIAYRKTTNMLRLPNGSRVILGGFKDENDIDKYIGIEYDVIIVEELNQLTKDKYEKLRGSLRTSKPGWRPRMYTSFNPGGRGHTFVKERYVIPYREHREKETRFIPSTYRANTFLNTEYIDYLEGLSSNLGRAWREGNWDVFAGQFFAEWDANVHTCSPRQIPYSWRKFRSIDIGGREGTTSCHWYALDNDGGVWVYREYYWSAKLERCRVGRDHDENAKQIKKLSENEDGTEEQYQYTMIDSSAFDKGGFGETAADIYERHGVNGLIPCKKGRLVGWNAVHYYLRWDANGHPKLQIFSTCYDMIRTLPLLQHSELNPEDVDTDGEDHAVDELAYFLVTLREQKSPAQLNAVEKRLADINRQRDGGFDYQNYRPTNI